MSVQAPSAPIQIPVPEDFPVSFSEGEDQLFWQQDRMHFPGQMTELEAQSTLDFAKAGHEHAARRYAMPIETMLARVIHGYFFSAMVPATGSPEEMAEAGRRFEERMLPTVADLRALWREEWLPEIKQHLEIMESIDLSAAPLQVLIAHFEDALDRVKRLSELHFEIVFPAYLAISEFDELYRDLVEDATEMDSYRLLQGFPNKTTEIGHDLFRLSRRALQSPEVQRVLETEAAADVRDRLAESSDGRRFLAELDQHLDAYGHRGHIWGIASPSFIEDPTPVIKTLKDYIGQPDAADPARELERLARERDEAIAEARAKLQGYPAPVVAQFEAMLESAQAGLVITEDHGFYIDFYGTELSRQIVIEIGRRYVSAGAVDRPEDLMHLRTHEIVAASNGLAHVGLRSIVKERRAALDSFADVTPPPVLGTMPAGPLPDDPMTRSMIKFFGGPPQAPEEPDSVKGASGSAGKVTGTARVVRSLDDAARLKAGEILVAETTAPPWTPLFATAAAVVTDTGGILSHCAVVAREYGIPAVVGTFMGTSVIADGDTIEVDGDAGVVRILR